MFKILKIFLKSYRGNFSDDETWNGGVEVVGKKLTQTMFGLHDHCCNQRCSVSHSYTWMVQNIQTNFTEQMFGVEAGNCEIVTRKLSSAVLRVTVFLSHWPQDCPCQPGTQLLHSADITDWRGEVVGIHHQDPSLSLCYSLSHHNYNFSNIWITFILALSRAFLLFQSV